jgi:hypothetical protein
MPQWLIKLLEQWYIVRTAPIPFAIAVVIAGIVLWFAIGWFYSGVLNSKIAQIELLDRQVADWKQKTEKSTPDEAKARIDDLEARVKRLEPRTLSAVQRSQIANFVQVPAGSTYVMVIGADMDCTDCYQYAIDFQGILSDAHWRHEMIRVMARQGASPKGVAIVTPDPSAPLPEAVALAHGLTAAGIPFDLTKGAELDPNGRGKLVAGLLITPKAGAYNSAGGHNRGQPAHARRGAPRPRQYREAAGDAATAAGDEDGDDGRHCSRGFQERNNGGTNTKERSDRKIDLALRDDHQHTERDHRGDRGLAHEVDDVPVAEEDAIGSHEEDQPDESDRQQ